MSKFEGREPADPTPTLTGLSTRDPTRERDRERQKERERIGCLRSSSSSSSICLLVFVRNVRDDFPDVPVHRPRLTLRRQTDRAEVERFFPSLSFQEEIYSLQLCRCKG